MKITRFFTLLFSIIMLFGCEEKPHIIEEYVSFNGIEVSHKPGFYEDFFQLDIKSSPNEKVYYTVNGKTPRLGTSHTRRYTDKLDLKLLSERNLHKIQTTPVNHTIRSYRWKKRYELPTKGCLLKISVLKNDSLVQKAVLNYVVDSDFYSNNQFKSLFINVDSADFFSQEKGIYVPGHVIDSDSIKFGNYKLKGKKAERVCSIVLYDEKGKEVFYDNARVRIQGLNTPLAPQKSLKFYADKGQVFEYDFFENRKRSSRFVLKSIFSGWDYGVFNNMFIESVCSSMKIDMMKQYPVDVYINGEYWGIQLLSEKDDEHFLASKYGDKKSNYDITLDNFHAKNGSSKSYRQLSQFIRSNDLKIDSNYKVFEQNMDVGSYIDYMCAEIFFNNLDWPCNNVMLWKHKDSTRWKSFLIDMDGTMLGSPNQNNFSRATDLNNTENYKPERCTILFRSALRNEKFKSQFKNRFLELLKNEFSEENLSKHLDNMYQLFDNEIESQNMRWKYPAESNYNKKQKQLYKWVDKRPKIIENQLNEFILGLH